MTEVMLNKVSDLADVVTHRLKEQREIVQKQKQLTERLAKLQEKNPDCKEKYCYASSFVEATMHQSRNCIGKLLSLTAQCATVGAKLNSCSTTSACRIDLSRQSNVFLLKQDTTMPPDYNATNFVKQCTSKWHDLRKQAPVSASTLHNALGLRQLKLQKDHIEKVLLHRDEEVPPELQRIFDYETENEINAMATCAAFAIPFLFPQKIVYVEEGGYFYGEQQSGDPLLVVSSDGSIRECTGQNISSQAFCAIEIKCPLEQTYKLPVYYEIPSYYVLQVLAQMAALKVTKSLFVSYSAESTTFSLVEFSRNYG